MEQLHKVYFRIIRISALCILPLVTLMILVGDDLIRILYSSKWEASIPIFRIILLGAMFMPFIIINGQAPAIMGDSRAYFYINLGKNALFLIVTFVSLRFGLLIFITCQTGLSVILMALNSLVVKFYYKIGLKAQLFAYLPYIFYSFMAGLAVFLAFHFSDLPPLFEAIAGSLLFVLLYALSIYVFERKTFKEALDIAKSGMNKLRPKNA